MNCEIMNRDEVESIVYDNISFSNVVGDVEEVEFVDGSFGTIRWLDSDGDEIEVCGYGHGKPIKSSRYYIEYYAGGTDNGYVRYDNRPTIDLDNAMIFDSEQEANEWIDDHSDEWKATLKVVPYPDFDEIESSRRPVKSARYIATDPESGEVLGSADTYEEAVNEWGEDVTITDSEAAEGQKDTGLFQSRRTIKSAKHYYEVLLDDGKYVRFYGNKEYERGDKLRKTVYDDNDNLITVNGVISQIIGHEDLSQSRRTIKSGRRQEVSNKDFINKLKSMKSKGWSTNVVGYKRNANSINTIFNSRRMIGSTIDSEVWDVSPISKELYNTCNDLDFKLVNPGRHFHKKYTFNSTKGEPSAECSIYVYPDNYSIVIRQAKWAPNDYDKWVDKLINVMNNLGLNFKKISMGGSAYNYEAEYTRSDIVDSLKSVTDELNSINPNELRYSSNLNPFSEGYNAYMKDNPTCPYKQGTQEFDDWIDGWQEAEMDMEP